MLEIKEQLDRLVRETAKQGDSIEEIVSYWFIFRAIKISNIWNRSK